MIMNMNPYDQNTHMLVQLARGDLDQYFKFPPSIYFTSTHKVLQIINSKPSQQ